LNRFQLAEPACEDEILAGIDHGGSRGSFRQIWRCLAFADIETPDHQLPIGSRAVEQDCDGAAVQLLQLLLLLGLREIGPAHGDSDLSLLRRIRTVSSEY
jgi:hypothetical protein